MAAAQASSEVQAELLMFEGKEAAFVELRSDKSEFNPSPGSDKSELLAQERRLKLLKAENGVRFAEMFVLTHPGSSDNIALLEDAILRLNIAVSNAGLGPESSTDAFGVDGKTRMDMAEYSIRKESEIAERLDAEKVLTVSRFPDRALALSGLRIWISEELAGAAAMRSPPRSP